MKYSVQPHILFVATIACTPIQGNQMVNESLFGPGYQLAPEFERTPTSVDSKKLTQTDQGANVNSLISAVSSTPAVEMPVLIGKGREHGSSVAVQPSIVSESTALPNVSLEIPTALYPDLESPARPGISPESLPLPHSAAAAAEAGAASAPPAAAGRPPPSADVPLTLPAAPPPPGAGRNRHRPEPGLAPSENKPSSRRTGVPDLDMLQKPSKPRKGVPPPPPGLSQGAELVPGAEHEPEPEPEPAPGAEPTVAGRPAAAAADERRRQHTDFAGPEELAGEPERATAAANLAKARASTLIGIAFITVFVLVIGWVVFRRVHDSWHHRHYRKMDFLVDGMYNL